jgi:hypothetical protein
MLQRNPVVAIGVDRHGGGRDNDPRLYCAQLRSNVTRKFALKGSVKVTLDDSCEDLLFTFDENSSRIHRLLVRKVFEHETR